MIHNPSGANTELSGACQDFQIDRHIPDDIRRLTDAYDNAFPVAIIAHIDSPLFPYEMDNPLCKYVVLGYFHILGVKVCFYPISLTDALTSYSIESNHSNG